MKMLHQHANLTPPNRTPKHIYRMYNAMAPSDQYRAPTILAILGGEGYLSVQDEQVILPIHAGCVYYLNPQTVFSLSCRDDSSTLHFIHCGVNESAAPRTNSSPACSIM